MDKSSSDPAASADAEDLRQMDTYALAERGGDGAADSDGDAARDGDSIDGGGDGSDESTDRGSDGKTPRTHSTDEVKTLDLPTTGDMYTPMLGRSQSDDAAVKERANTISPKYQLVRELGRGGMGSVFLARDMRLGRLVAIKFLDVQNSDLSARFITEARMTAQCNHENIVVLYEADEHEGQPYMVLEYLQGKTLRQLMDESANAATPGQSAPAGMSSGRAIEVIIPVLRALERAHGMGIVHRDLKPENIMLTDTGTVKVLDFGIAKILASNERRSQVDLGRVLVSDPSSPSAETQGIVGTPPYMAPEQLNSDTVDHQTDIWAVGIMLHEMIVGQHPLGRISARKIAEVADFNVSMPRLSELRPELGELGSIIDRALLKQRADRTASARAMLDELQPLIAGTSGSAEASDERNPFTGLEAFQEGDATRFFGRDKDVASVVNRVRSQPLVAVLGPSGVGKSSLVRAGVVPALKRSGEGWEAFIVRPGRAPLESLADVLTHLHLAASTARMREDSGAKARGRSGDRVPDRVPDRATVVARLRSEPGYLGTTLRVWAQRKLRRVVLFVDQFEELYTQGIDKDERAAFRDCLTGVADDASSPLRVILSMRADFLELMARARKFMTVVTRGLVVLAPMDRDSLRQALTEPIATVGYEYEDARLVEDMLDGLEATPGALPLLQFAANSLWHARDRERRLLTRASYDAMGGIGGALAKHADRVLAAMPASEVKLVRLVFERLVTPERTRAIARVDELLELSSDTDAIKQTIRELAHARLLHTELSERAPTNDDHEQEEARNQISASVEIVHESLISSWPTLAHWLAENQDDAQYLVRLRAAAREWHRNGRTNDLLWRGQAADNARRFAARGFDTRAKLSPRERDFVHAVVALSTRSRRLRRTAVSVAFVLLIAIAIVVSALAARADRQATRADQQARRADAKAILAERSAAEARESEQRARESAASARNASRLASATLHRSDATLVLALVREMEPEGSVPNQWRELARWATQQDLAEVVLVHPGGVSAAVFSPDGKRIATAASDNDARIWNAYDADPPIVLSGHEDVVFAIDFSPDGSRVVTSSFDQTARIWNADGTGQPIVLKGHTGRVASARFSRDGKRVVTASLDKTARVWNADGTGEPVVLGGHIIAVTGACFSPDGQRVATSSYEGIARIFNADGSGAPAMFTGHQAGIGTIDFSSDGTRFLTSSLDKTARVWNVDGSGHVALVGHEDAVTFARFSPDGKRVVTSSFDQTIRVWNADGSGSPVVRTGHKSWIASVGFSPDGKHIVSGSFDNSARTWPVDTSAQPIILAGHENAVKTVLFSPDGSHILLIPSAARAYLWNIDGSGSPTTLAGHQDEIVSARFSPDGRRIVTASKDKTARVWSIDDGRELVVLAGHTERLSSADFSPDGQRIVTAASDKTARVWNADGTGQPIVLTGHDTLLSKAIFSPDGRRIVTASYDNTARIWNADGTGQPVVLAGHTDHLEIVRFTRDGTRILTVSFDKTARLWNADGTGQPVVLSGHQDRIVSAALSPDGRKLLTASMDKTARIWQLDASPENGTLPFVELSGHMAALAFSGTATGDGSFSPDGARVVTIADDKMLRIWNADGSGEPATQRLADADAYMAAFSPDGQRIVTTSHNERNPTTGSIKYWVTLWPTFTRFANLDDPTLWTATRYCPPVELRRELLGVAEDLAAAQVKACQERVSAALAARAK